MRRKNGANGSDPDWSLDFTKPDPTPTTTLPAVRTDVRPPKHQISQRSQYANKAISRRFLANVGGLEVVQNFLRHNDDPRAEILLAMLLDSTLSRASFHTLYRKAGLSMVDVMDMFRRWRLDEVMVEIYNAAPPVFSDIAVDARSTMVACERCDGLGKIERKGSGKGNGKSYRRACPNCEGSGRVRKVGDKDARMLISEGVGVTGKRAGPIVNVNFGEQVPTMEATMSKTADVIDLKRTDTQADSRVDERGE